MHRRLYACNVSDAGVDYEPRARDVVSCVAAAARAICKIEHNVPRVVPVQFFAHGASYFGHGACVRDVRHVTDVTCAGRTVPEAARYRIRLHVGIQVAIGGCPPDASSNSRSCVLR